MKRAITAETLKSMLRYDRDTGKFFWAIDMSSTAQAGNEAGTDRYGYVVITIDGSKYRAHRLAWLFVFGEWPSGVIDHINGRRSDNRIENLRDVTVSINTQNQTKANRDSKTGVLGVSKHSLCDKFVSQITVNNKRIYLGLFDTAELANLAYVDAKRKFHEGCTI